MIRSLLLALVLTASACTPPPRYIPLPERSGTLEERLFPTEPTPVQEPRTVRKIAEVGEHGIAAELRDPASAQFRNVSVLKISDGDFLVCAEVNAKNGYGGYVGFTRAVARITAGIPVGTYMVPHYGILVMEIGADAAVRAACRQPSVTLTSAGLREAERTMASIKQALRIIPPSAER